MKKSLLGSIILVAGVVLIAVLFMRHATVEAPVIPPTATNLATSTATNTTTTETSSVSEVSDQPVLSPEAQTERTFSGTLTEVNTGCFADGECSVLVAGAHVTVLVGRRQEAVGSVVGVPSIGDLESYIGDIATVYAKQLPDGTYTLYGKERYYIAVTPKVTASKCVVRGCSSQLCLSEDSPDIATTCEWQDKYSCYQGATCERQTDGQCGWTETETFLQCLADNGTKNE